MYLFSKKISKNFAIELSGGHFVRRFRDGITFLELELEADWYKGDHKPSLHICITVLNFILVEFNIYNINHLN